MAIKRRALKPSTSLSAAVFWLKVNGVWHFNGRFSKIYKIYGVIMYTILLIFPTIAMISFVFTVLGNLIKIADGLYFTSTMIGLVCKVGLPKFQKIRALVERIDSEILTRQNVDQDIFIEEAMDTARKNIRIVHFIFSFSCFMRGLVPLLTDDFVNKKLPEAGYYFMDTTKSPNYEIIFCYQVFGIWLGAMMNGSLDTLIAGLMAHAGGQLKVLKHSLENVREKALKNNNIHDFDKNYCDCKHKEFCSNKKYLEKSSKELNTAINNEINNCVIHHKAIIDWFFAFASVFIFSKIFLSFVAEIEDTFNGAIFAQFFAGISVICITGFELTIIKPFTMPFYNLLIYQLGITLQCYLYCFYGNEIFFESSTIGDSIYMSEWYRFGKEINKSLWIIMERTKRPLQVTAGKIITLSMDTFVSIMRSSYSFYAVLRKMNEDIEIEI